MVADPTTGDLQQQASRLWTQSGSTNQADEDREMRWLAIVDYCSRCCALWEMLQDFLRGGPADGDPFGDLPDDAAVHVNNKQRWVHGFVALQHAHRSIGFDDLTVRIGKQRIGDSRALAPFTCRSWRYTHQHDQRCPGFLDCQMLYLQLTELLYRALSANAGVDDRQYHRSLL